MQLKEKGFLNLPTVSLEYIFSEFLTRLKKASCKICAAGEPSCRNALYFTKGPFGIQCFSKLPWKKKKPPLHWETTSKRWQ